MFNKSYFGIIITLASALVLSSCALQTAGSKSSTAPATAGATLPSATTAAASNQTQPITTAGQTNTPGTSAPLSTSAPVTVPGTTSGSTWAGTIPGTTASSQGTTGPVRTSASNPIDPDDIKTGKAYDTATVRDWIRNGPAAAYYPKNKLVFLTLDDGPSKAVTPKVLDILKKNGVNATFFYHTQGDLTSRADQVRRTLAEGHAIAIHTSSHNYKKLYPGRKANVEALVADVSKAAANVQDIAGDTWHPTVYRFPGGSFSWTGSASARKAMASAKKALSDMGVEYLDWNALTGDSDLGNKDKSPKGLVRYAIKTTEQAYGTVIVLLMHDAAHNTATPEALQGIIDYYKGRGFEFGILK